MARCSVASGMPRPRVLRLMGAVARRLSEAARCSPPTARKRRQLPVTQSPHRRNDVGGATWPEPPPCAVKAFLAALRSAVDSGGVPARLARRVWLWRNQSRALFLTEGHTVLLRFMGSATAGIPDAPPPVGVATITQQPCCHRHQPLAAGSPEPLHHIALVHNRPPGARSHCRTTSIPLHRKPAQRILSRTCCNLLLQSIG